MTTHDDNDEETAESQLGGVIDREYWGWDHKACVILCRTPRKRAHKTTCPECYGKAIARPVDEYDIAPWPTRLGIAAGYIARAVRDALEVLRWNPDAPLFTLRWRVPRYLECPECAEHQEVSRGSSALVSAWHKVMGRSGREPAEGPETNGESAADTSETYP